MFELIYAKNVTKDTNKFQLKAFYTSNIFQIILLLNYRLRIGKYRVLFDVDWNNHQILILKNGHRSHIYQ